MEGFLAGNHERYVEVLENDFPFHRGPVWGTSVRARLTATLRAG